ncbi:MAG TPA: hypothetical protein VGG48_14110 [Rhizomicrobium sp.]|jgi:hypothetical protein
MIALKRKFGPKDGRTYLQNAHDRWGQVPDWVEALARQAQLDGNQSKTARTCGFTNASTVSGVINKTYPGRLDKIEAQVRGALMHLTVICPVMGSIGRNDCVAYQGVKFSAANPQRARLSAACKSCPNAIGGNHA